MQTEKKEKSMNFKQRKQRRFSQSCSPSLNNSDIVSWKPEGEILWKQSRLQVGGSMEVCLACLIRNSLENFDSYLRQLWLSHKESWQLTARCLHCENKKLLWPGLQPPTDDETLLCSVESYYLIISFKNIETCIFQNMFITMKLPQNHTSQYGRYYSL